MKNTGHGWVYARPDGMRARCGGPKMCRQCAQDLLRKKSEEPEQARKRAGIEKVVQFKGDLTAEIASMFGWDCEEDRNGDLVIYQKSPTDFLDRCEQFLTRMGQDTNGLYIKIESTGGITQTAYPTDWFVQLSSKWVVVLQDRNLPEQWKLSLG